ncbi:LysR family transcriptional regulator [Thiotrichales bacterium 19S3-7]|nr:LysR family transcriptional regulator [Thiotrichales bacterium 19S3-7]MCF6800844.1 LysR family transcriptional regulator [Thiotrichales bacterium 19S3-11]
MKYIQTFLAIVDYGSFTEASERLFLTQPTITKRIAQLEDKLNNALFRRVGHKVYLTDAGNAFLPYARKIQQNWIDTTNLMADYSQNVIGTLILRCNYHLGLYVLPQLMKKYMLDYPNVKLEMDFNDSDSIIKEVVDYKAEIGLITLLDNSPQEVAHTTIRTSNVSIVIAASHPFWNQQGSYLERLAKIPVITPKKQNQYHTKLHQLIRKFDIKPPEITNINMIEAIKELVETGIGWSIMHDYMLNDQLRAIPILDKPIKISAGVIYRKDAVLSKPARKWIETALAIDSFADTK